MNPNGAVAFEAEALQIEFFDEGIDDSYRVVLGNEVVETLWQQGDLASILSFDESLHPATRFSCVATIETSTSALSSVSTQPRPAPVLER